MSYAEKTFRDPNPVKRFFQNRRLADAARLCALQPGVKMVVDFGAGDGELCKRLAAMLPDASIVCYEPHPELLAQARANLSGIDRVSCTDDPAQLPRTAGGLVFCLEVFEHLPGREAEAALGLLEDLLAANGIAVIGVPVEIGVPALYKGAFRMLRRFGEFDARPGNVLAAAAGRPPADRPVVELLPDSYYHLHHLGFDHRRFRQTLAARFTMIRTSASPFRCLGTWINSEAYYAVCRKAGNVS